MRTRSTFAAGLALAALAALPAPSYAGPAKERALVVVIDAGHGGLPPHEGARGPRGMREKTVVLAVARKLKAALDAEGATAILTREEDVDMPLAARAMLANEADADLFLSIHCNSMATADDRRTTQGVETYFLSPDPTDAEAKLLAEMENGGPESLPTPRGADPVSGLLAALVVGQARNDSAQLAQLVQRALVRSLGAQGRGVRQAPFLVLSALKMPAALVEIGFISHPSEGRRLGKEKYQEQVAAALAAAVREFADQVLSRRLTAGSAQTEVAKAKPMTEPRMGGPRHTPTGSAGPSEPRRGNPAGQDLRPVGTVAGFPATR